MSNSIDDVQKGLEDKQLPNIGIKITREGDVLKFDTKDYTLRLKPIEGGRSQEYPLLLLDKFVTEVTTKMLREFMDAKANRDNTKHVLDNIVGEANDAMVDNAIKRIHNDLFPEQ